jgi:hypothetical protein
LGPDYFCTGTYKAIRTVFGGAVAIQYDSFHMMQNVWRHLWKWAVARRRQLKARSQAVTTPLGQEEAGSVGHELAEEPLSALQGGSAHA